jgi:3-oxoacyl-[acyl-carrier protein] reductase
MLERFDLQGKVAAVTGSGAGLGRAYALALAAAGADVVINDVRDQAVDTVVQEIVEAGGRAVGVVGSVADTATADGLVAKALEAFGRFDIMVNNAGIGRPAMLWKMSDQDWLDVISVNLTGVYYCTRAAARHLREQGSGRIINITSAAGIEGSTGQINYAAAKAGVIGLTKSAAKELARYGVTVNAVSPVAATEMTEKIRTDPKFLEISMARLPMKRFAEPEEVASVIVFLASDAASYMTGGVVLADGGMSM